MGGDKMCKGPEAGEQTETEAAQSEASKPRIPGKVPQAAGGSLGSRWGRPPGRV